MILKCRVCNKEIYVSSAQLLLIQRVNGPVTCSNECLAKFIEDEAKSVDPNMTLIVKQLGETIKATLPENIGFALMVFDFRQDGFYWMSNGDRQDIINALREVIKQNDVH